MAIFSMEFPDDFLSDLLDTNIDEIAKEALDEAAPLLEDAMKKCCAEEIQHDGDSELVNSIRSRRPKRVLGNEAWIVGVYPSGYSSTKRYTSVNSKGRKTNKKYPVSNALKAIWKEYGIPGKQPPRPFIDRACNSVKSKVMEAMQKIYNRKVGAK